MRSIYVSLALAIMYLFFELRLALAQDVETVGIIISETAVRAKVTTLAIPPAVLSRQIFGKGKRKKELKANKTETVTVTQMVTVTVKGNGTAMSTGGVSGTERASKANAAGTGGGQHQASSKAVSAGLSVPTTALRFGKNSTQPPAIGATGSSLPFSLPPPGGQNSNGGVSPPTNVTVNGCPCTCQCPSEVFPLSGTSQTPATPLGVMLSTSAPSQGSPFSKTLQTVVSSGTEAPPAPSCTSTSLSPSPSPSSNPSSMSSISLAVAQPQAASSLPETLDPTSGLNLQTFTLQTAVTVPLNLGSSSATVAR